MSATAAVDTAVASQLDRVTIPVLAAARDAGVHFGLVDSPPSVVDMLLGRRVDLVTYTLALPAVSAGLSKS